LVGNGIARAPARRYAGGCHNLAGGRIKDAVIEGLEPDSDVLAVMV